MAVAIVQPPADATPQKKSRQGRSPAFPFISLQKALERAETFRVAEGGRPKHFAPLTAVAKAWGIGAKTGIALQTVAALGHYGLFEFQGVGDERNARLTDTALNILLDKQPASPERDALIRRAATKPPIHNELWQKWGASLPSDATFETFLVRDKGFSESGARDLIAEYKATVQFAKLGQSGTIPSGEMNKNKVEREEPTIGDFIQVEIDGALALEKPAKVRAIKDHEGQKWVFVEGSETGIPMEQVVVEQKGQGGSGKPSVVPPTLKEEIAPPRPGTRKEVFALDEGDVVLTFPDNLSAASFHDLEGYMQLFLRKAQRRAGAGDYFAEVYAPDGIKAKEVRYFDDFAPLLEFVKAFKARNSNDILRMHLPARASNQERQTATEVGGSLVL